MCPRTIRCVLDAFVDTLDLREFGFEHAKANSGIGQPAFDPSLLLKLYLCGTQEGVRSSRRLEGETRRNMEVMGLCQGGEADTNLSNFHTKATLERELKRLDAADAQSKKCAVDPVLGATVEAAVEKLRNKMALQEPMQEN